MRARVMATYASLRSSSMPAASPTLFMWGNSVSSMPATNTQSNSRPFDECTVIMVTAWPSSATVSRSVRRRTHSMKSASESPRRTRTGLSSAGAASSFAPAKA